MNEYSADKESGFEGQELVLVSGLSGAGRSTALRMFEDLAFEVVDNLPLSMLSDLLDRSADHRRIAVVYDIRNRDFSKNAFTTFLRECEERSDLEVTTIFLDCRPDVLIRRFSETRRPHPLSANGIPEEGILREIELMSVLRDTANDVIDTSDLGPRDLQAEIKKRFQTDNRHGELSISVQSFSYKRGAPAGLDLMFDCRFLQNPHWVPELRVMTGKDASVVSYVTADSRYPEFVDKVLDLLSLLLSAVAEEGKSHFTVGFGCTGGKHRSVVVTEAVAQAIASSGWRVTSKHWEVDRNASQQ